MKPIIVTYSNESWVIYETFGKNSYICFILGGTIPDIITSKDIKLIARPKRLTNA